MARKRKPKNNSIKNIVIGLVLFAVAIYTGWLIAQRPEVLGIGFLANLNALRDHMGIVGALLYLVMTAIAGHGVVLFPIGLLIAAVCLVFFVRPNILQWIGLVLGTLDVLAFLHMNVSYFTLKDNLALGLSGSGGGVIGALVSFLLEKAVGEMGAYIILFFVMVVALVFLFYRIVKQRNGEWIQDVKNRVNNAKLAVMNFIFVDEEISAKRKAAKEEQKALRMAEKEERLALKTADKEERIAMMQAERAEKEAHTQAMQNAVAKAEKSLLFPEQADVPVKEEVAEKKIETTVVPAGNRAASHTDGAEREGFFKKFLAKKQGKAEEEKKTQPKPVKEEKPKVYTVIPKEKSVIMDSMAELHKTMDEVEPRVGLSPRGPVTATAATYGVKESVDDFQQLLEKRNVTSSFASDDVSEELSVIDRWTLAGLERAEQETEAEKQLKKQQQWDTMVSSVEAQTEDKEAQKLAEQQKEDAQLDAMLAAEQRNTNKVVGFSRGENGARPANQTTKTEPKMTTPRGGGITTNIPSARGIQVSVMQSEKDKEEFPTQQKPVVREYQLPSVNLLDPAKNTGAGNADNDTKQNIERLEQTLADFGVKGKIVNVSRGPAVTQYEFQPAPGVKVSKITNLADDIALSMAVTDVRMEAPIPGKAAIGIELPNKQRTTVCLRELIESEEFKNSKAKTTIALGKDISGNAIVADLAKMPHVLIAGSTGSGKSVCMNTLINSILYKAKPDEVKFLMVDPKKVELTNYNGIPHLIAPVVTDAKKAASALRWAVNEMDKRYDMFANAGVKDMVRYNRLMEERRMDATTEEEKQKYAQMPYIIVLIDELADLMMVAPADVEDAICRLAQLARAAGIHLVVATQRPSVDVITGIIKANMPSRIAFAVSSQVDSRTILDMAGAEKLLGYGDMLFYPTGMPKPQRLQGVYVSDGEIERITDAVKAQEKPVYNDEIGKMAEAVEQQEAAGEKSSGENWDELIPEATKLFIESGQASVSLLQRRFRVGYTRAARIVDQMEQKGLIGPYEGSKPRQILITLSQYEDMVEAGEL